MTNAPVTVASAARASTPIRAAALIGVASLLALAGAPRGAFAQQVAPGAKPAQEGGSLAALREQEARSTNASLPPDQRRIALDQSIGTRRDVIASTTNPLERARLLLDQADAISRRLALDGWDSTALVGALPLDTRASQGAFALEAADAAAQGAEALRAHIAAVEAGKAAQPDKTEFEGLLALRDRRAPAIVARSAMIAWAFAPDDAAKRALATRAAAAAEGLKETDAERDARRLTIAGLARRALGESGAALTHLQLAAANAQSGATKLEASLGHVLAVLDDRGPAPARAILKGAISQRPFVIDDKPQALPLFLAADVAFRIGEREAAGAPEGPARDAALAAAYAAYADLLGREDLGLDERQRQSVVFHRLNAVSPDDPEALAHAPALVALVKGSMMMFTEGKFDAALAIIEGVTAKDSARLKSLGPRGADAMLALARLRESEAKAWEEDVRLVPAIEALRRLAREYPASANAPVAIANACRFAQGLTRTHERDTTFEALYAATLADAVELFPAHAGADAWRVELAQRRLMENKIDEGLALLDGVASDPDLVLQARVAAAQTAARVVLTVEGEDLKRKAAGAASPRVEAALRAIADVRSRQASPDKPAPNLDAIEATVRAHRASLGLASGDAAPALAEATEALTLAERANAGQEAISIALFTKATAAARVGRLAESLEAGRRLASAFPTYANPALLELVDAATTQVRQAERAGDSVGAATLAKGTLVPASRLGLETAERTKSPGVDAWKAQLGEALGRAGEAPDEAIGLLDDLIARRGPDDRTMLWLAEARLTKGETELVKALLRDLMPSVEQKVEQNQAPTETFWRAWSRALPLLVQGATPEQAEQARRRIALLRLRDASLGGEPFASRIKDAETKLTQNTLPAPPPR